MKTFFLIILAFSSLSVFASTISIGTKESTKIFNEMKSKQPLAVESSESGEVRTLGDYKTGAVVTCIGFSKKAKCKISIFDEKGNI